MAEFDFKDFYIGYKSHPKFIINKIIEEDIIRVIIQKYEVLLFTNKGDLLGDPDFGCDLTKILFQTKISSHNVKKIIEEQIAKYIQELSDINYTIEVSFVTDPNNYQDVLIIDFKLYDYVVNAVFI